MINIKCAICGKDQKLVDLYQATFDLKKINKNTFSARRTPDRMHYKFVKCLNCSLIFSNPILEREKIEKLYSSSDFNYQTESDYLKETYWNYLKKALPKRNWNKLKVLEIGCGNGFFLEKVKDMGIKNVYGVEPGKASVEKAPKEIKKNIKVDILKPGLFKNNSFDIICCFHTLDHIIDPNTFIKEIFALLKKGGKIIFIVHDTEGLSVKLFGEKSAIFDIEHIFLFNKKSLKNIFAKNKFKKTEVFDIENNYPLSYWSRMVPLQKDIKKILLTLFEKLYIGSIPIKIKAGNIGILAQK